MPDRRTVQNPSATNKGPPCHHAAATAKVRPGGSVAVIGDGAVGLCGVLAAKRLGAERIIIMGRHPDRIALAKEIGATEVVSERGDAVIERVRELTGGFGLYSVLECVGSEQAISTAMRIVRPAVGRVSVPHYQSVPAAEQMFYDNVSVAGGPAPVRAYIAELLPDVMEGVFSPASSGRDDGQRPRHRAAGRRSL